MTAKQTRRLLIVAFVLSLLLHAIVAGVFRWSFKPSEENQLQVIHVTHIRQIRIARATPTPPPPPPSPKPARSAAPTSAPARAHRPTSVHGTRPAAAQQTVAHPAATATPMATPTPNCLRTDTPVAVAASPPPPEIPAAARNSQTGGTTRIDVTIDSSGNVTAAAIGQTSGDAQLDQIALLMAREARYAPATRACKPIASQYAYTVRFIAW